MIGVSVVKSSFEWAVLWWVVMSEYCESKHRFSKSRKNVRSTTWRNWVSYSWVTQPPILSNAYYHSHPAVVETTNGLCQWWWRTKGEEDSFLKRNRIFWFFWFFWRCNRKKEEKDVCQPVCVSTGSKGCQILCVCVVYRFRKLKKKMVLILCGSCFFTLRTT